jgi:hypothetical protein
MSKIYNEIIIDMNPESSTFEETLYEDSFEYSGDMMFAQGANQRLRGKEQLSTGGVPPSTQPDADEYLSKVGQNSIKYEGKYYYYYADGFKEIDPSTAPGFNETSYKDVTALMKDFEGGSPYGAPTLTKADFINADGSQKSPDEVADALFAANAGKGKGGTDAQGNPKNWSRDEIKEQVLKLMPKYLGPSQEEQDFITQQYGGQFQVGGGRHGEESGVYGFEEFGPGPDGIYGTPDDPGGISGQEAGLSMRAAGATKEAGLRELQKGAKQVGAAGQAAISTGMASKMRDVAEGQESLAKGLGTTYEAYGAAEDVYGLAGEKAKLAAEKAAHGLTGTAEKEFETDVANIFFAKGGRVPSSKSFSHFLTQLPDAGGI